MPTPDHVSPTRAGRRERKKLETRERIFESGVALFAAHGYDSTTMEQIGERATCHGRRSSTTSPGRKTSSSSGSDDYEPGSRRPSPRTSSQGRLDEPAPPRVSRARRPLRGRPRDRTCHGARLAARRRPTARRRIGRTPARGRQRARWTTSGRHPRGVDPDRAALILFDTYLGVLYRWVLDETDQLALGEQLTATLDLILPAIIRTSSVDTNGPSHRTGTTRRTS